MLHFARRLQQFYGLPRDEARRILGVFAARSPANDPWSVAELDHKLDETSTRLLHESGIAPPCYRGWSEGQVPGVGALGVVWWPLRAPKNTPPTPPAGGGKRVSISRAFSTEAVGDRPW